VTKVYLSVEEIEEFKVEAEELLEVAESSLLALDKGGDFGKYYDAIFRAFHSVKGAAGMLNWSSLQHHMHLIENHFQQCKGLSSLAKVRVTYFLDGIDASRKLLALQEIDFKYELPGEGESRKSAIEAKGPLPGQKAPPSVLEKRVPPSAPRPILNKNSIPVIVLDDEPDIVEILTEILTDGGYEVFGYTSSELALQEVALKKPQAFFSDMNMPNLSGLDVLRAINKIDSDIPLIFVSAHLSKEILIESLSYGVYGAIEKPFNVNQILAIAENATRRYQLGMLLNRSMNFVMYQFSALEEYLTEKGLIEIKEMMVKEMQLLLDVRRELREFREARVNAGNSKAS
jgi:DNA-binding response OmpR family regulator/HPt (histidine-containing phosphotransfer) domain-containing protein